jgi:hypothetical protein
MSIDLTKEFGLTEEQSRLMFSFQYLLAFSDAECENNEEKKKLKKEWLKKWSESIDDFLKTDKLITAKTINDNSIKNLIASAYEANSKYKVPFYLILLELSLFTPYYSLSKNDKFKSLKYRRNIQFLEEIAAILRLEADRVNKFISSNDGAIRGLTNFWPKLIGGALGGAVLIAITAGLAAPAIGALFAAGGIYGAAATASGLALLGGGAIAAGGLGMAGGVAVIVGGGALLGVAAGSGVGALLANAPKFTLQQAAKLEVAMREILIGQQKDVRLIQEIIKEQRKTLKTMEDKLFELEGNREHNKKEIKNLKESIDYLKKAIERNR